MEEFKSKLITSCRYLEEELQECSRKEGVTMSESVETLEVDLRTQTKQLGAKEKARRKKCDVGFSLIKNNRVFQKNFMRIRVRKSMRTGLVLARGEDRRWVLHPRKG